MPVLHLENVPADLLKRIEQLAQRMQQAPEATVIQVLEQAVPRDLNDERKRVREILENIRQSPIVPRPDTPDCMELLREDRNR
jgi:hypothetical protein